MPGAGNGAWHLVRTVKVLALSCRGGYSDLIMMPGRLCQGKSP